MRLGLFLEDQGHENLLCELVMRIAATEDVEAAISVRNAVGGSGQVLTSLRRYLRDLARGTVDFTEVLIVAIDGNCQGANAKHKEIRDIAAQAAFGGRLVCAVPDPHIEVWYLADGVAVASIVGGGAIQPAVPAAKCERAIYKRHLRAVFESGQLIPPLGGLEYGDEIAREMDLDTARHRDASFSRFVSDLTSAIRELKASGLG